MLVLLWVLDLLQLKLGLEDGRQVSAEETQTLSRVTHSSMGQDEMPNHRAEPPHTHESSHPWPR